MALDTKKNLDFANKTWDETIVPDARRVHQDPEQVADVRPAVAASTATWTRRSSCSRAGPPAARSRGLTLEVVRLDGRTPVIFMEMPGEPATRHRAALRPPRQAAGDDRLGDGLGPWTPVHRAATSSTAAAAPTTATRSSPRSPRSRRCSAAAVAARALRRAHRGVRGERQLRSARYIDAPRAAHRHAEPGGVPRLGLRQLRPAVGHDVAARPRRRRPRRRGARPKACTPATPSGIVPSSFRILRQLLDRARGLRRPGRSCRASSHVEIPTRARRRRRARVAKVLGDEVLRRSSRSPPAPRR